MMSFSGPLMRKEHARCQSEHGHWLKDIQIWRNRQNQVQEALANLREMMNDFEILVKQEIQHINVHDHALKADFAQLADGSAENHARTQWLHEELKRRHEGIVDVIKQLGRDIESSNLHRTGE